MSDNMGGTLDYGGLDDLEEPMSGRYPIHKPWCTGISHDGECPSEADVKYLKSDAAEPAEVWRAAQKILNLIDYGWLEMVAHAEQDTAKIVQNAIKELRRTVTGKLE